MRIARRGWHRGLALQIRLSSPQAVTAANAKERRHQAVEHKAEDYAPGGPEGWSSTPRQSPRRWSPTPAKSAPAFAVDLLLVRAVHGRREAIVRRMAVGHCRSALGERGARGGWDEQAGQHRILHRCHHSRTCVFECRCALCALRTSAVNLKFLSVAAAR